MNLTERDRRALIVLAVAGVLILGYWWFTRNDTVRVVAVSTDSIPATEKRLLRVRQVAATVPGKQQVLEQVNKELAVRERGLIQADTAAQAQAQLLQIIRKIAKSQPSPVDLRNTEIGPVKPFGDRYGEVTVSVNFESGIEQLINFLADVTVQKELIGTTDMRIGAANPKQKTMPVRLTLSALVRRELVPDRKAAATF